MSKRIPHTGTIRLLAGVIFALAIPCTVHAASSAGTTYRIQEAVMAPGGGTSSSASYVVTGTLGEPFIGPGSSSSYEVGQDFVAQMTEGLTISLDSTAMNLGSVAPQGVAVGATTVTVRTDAAAGYSLFAYQNHDLLHTDGFTTVPAFSGTIATPAAWSDATSIGLGISVIAGTGVDPRWGTSPNFKYAGLTGTTTSLHTKVGYQVASDATTIQYRMRTAANQLVGSYSSQVIYSAVGNA